jgi:hypothetical protein
VGGVPDVSSTQMMRQGAAAVPGLVNVAFVVRVSALAPETQHVSPAAIHARAFVIRACAASHPYVSCPVTSVHTAEPSFVVLPCVSVQEGSLPPDVPAVVHRHTRSFPTVGAASCRRKLPTLYAVLAAQADTADHFVDPQYQFAIVSHHQSQVAERQSSDRSPRRSFLCRES